MEAEAVGTVVLALSAILGLFVIVAKPMLNLDRTITELEATLRHMQEVMAERGRRIDETEARLDRAEDRIVDHEYRIKRVEEGSAPPRP
jgi:chromosome segregation ATPase